MSKNEVKPNTPSPSNASSSAIPLQAPTSVRQATPPQTEGRRGACRAPAVEARHGADVIASDPEATRWLERAREHADHAQQVPRMPPDPQIHSRWPKVVPRRLEFVRAAGVVEAPRRPDEDPNRGLRYVPPVVSFGAVPLRDPR